MLKRVSFSGIDQWTKPKELQELYQKYPFVEFVYLLSENQKAGNRYPRPVILKAYKKIELPMATHLCGKIAMELIHTNDWKPVYDLLGNSWDLFSRIQINIPKTRHFSRELTWPEDKEIIIQLHEGTKEFFEHYRHLPNVQGFQDGSGGRGIVSSEWMAPQTEFFGYAGGIGPDNVVQTVQSIQSICTSDFWIDMESGIRTNDKFDVEKCENICRALTQAGLVASE
ncbi:MAG: hypothetical protein IJ313_09210 [Clostridia bacterium]|nr:hypothetical protein [Clostridia bacterium]